MVDWKTVALLGGAAIAVGAIASYTKAGEGLRQIGGGLAEIVSAPIREGARAFGTIGEEVAKFGGGLGGAFSGVRAEIQAWIDMINKLQGVKPPYESGGCLTIPAGEPCPTDKPYERQNGQCCWGTGIRQGARTQAQPIPIRPAQPQIPIRQACEPNILPGYGQVGWKSGNVGFGYLADCEAYRLGGR